MKDIIEELILLLCLTGIIATCGIYHVRQADRAVQHYSEVMEMGGEMKPWQEKANKLIYNACAQSYNCAQISRLTGKRYKHHVPYTVPQIAEDLINCLNQDDEIGAKTIFLSYDGMKIT